jgi:hypothetical protein
MLVPLTFCDFSAEAKSTFGSQCWGVHGWSAFHHLRPSEMEENAGRSCIAPSKSSWISWTDPKSLKHMDRWIGTHELVSKVLHDWRILQIVDLQNDQDIILEIINLMWYHYKLNYKYRNMSYYKLSFKRICCIAVYEQYSNIPMAEAGAVAVDRLQGTTQLRLAAKWPPDRLTAVVAVSFLGGAWWSRKVPEVGLPCNCARKAPVLSLTKMCIKCVSGGRVFVKSDIFGPMLFDQWQVAVLILWYLTGQAVRTYHLCHNCHECEAFANLGDSAATGWVQP